MSDELNELQSITHQYRRSLEAYEARTGRAPQTVDSRGSGEEKEKFAKMDADLTAVELLAQNKALEARLAKIENQPTLTPRPSTSRVEDSEAYRNAWFDGLRRGSFNEMRAIMGVATSGATVTGATTVPTDFERRVIELMYNNSPIRSVATINNVDSKRTIPVEAALPTAALVAENGSISASDPTFGTSISVVPYKFVCATKMTQEFIEDAYGQGSVGTGMEYVARKVALALSRKMNEYFEIGTGSSEPQGIFHSSASSNTVDIGGGGSGNAWSDDITADLLLDAIHSVGPQYRQSPRFRWMMKDSCLKVVRKLKAGSEYIWTMAPDRGQSATSAIPGLIWGVPYLVSENSAEATTSTNGTIYAVVGNFEYFEIFDRTGITTFIDPYSSASTHCTTLYTYARTDSHSMNPAAFCKITA